ncbi:MAG: tetratricopeptide repeat protein [Pseudomonadota bacterium]
MDSSSLQKAGLIGLIATLGAILLWGFFEMGFWPSLSFESDPTELAGENIEVSLLPAAERGDVRSQWFLGLVYLNGEDAPQDLAKAAKWFRRAAEQGHPAAQLNLGRMYQLGEGVERDLIEAYKWMSLASDSFPKSDGRTQAETTRDIIAQQLQPEEMEQARQAVAEWRSKKEDGRE